MLWYVILVLALLPGKVGVRKTVIDGRATVELEQYVPLAWVLFNRFLAAKTDTLPPANGKAQELLTALKAQQPVTTT